MNNFERVAIFTAIENIETQIKGVKTLIAASSNQQPVGKHTVTSGVQQDTDELSDEEEELLEKTLKEAGEREVQRMQKQAEVHYQKEFDIVLKSLDG